MEEEDFFDFDLLEDAEVDGPPPQATLLLMGLDDSGKTSLTASLCYGEIIETTPTDLRDETPYCHNGVNLMIRELGGRFRFRGLWYENLAGADALIWVIDSRDRGRVFESKEEFEALVERPEIAAAPVLLVLNRQDAPAKMDAEQILEWFEIAKYSGRKISHIHASRAACSELVEGVGWIVGELGLVPPAADEEEQNKEAGG